jgi:hypothetical protein
MPRAGNFVELQYCHVKKPINMNRFKRISALIFVSLSLLLACKGKNGNSASNDSGVADKGTPDAAASGNASFSATIDDQPVTGKGTDQLQLQNTAFIYPAQGNNDKYILFDLNSVRNGADFYGFRFYSPDKEGQFAVENAKKDGYRCSVRLDFNLRSVDNFAIYFGDSVTVTIATINSTGISGTFAGEFKLSDLSRSKPYKNRIIVTDGKFDIPFSTGNLRPE